MQQIGKDVKISIDEKEYEISEECLYGLLDSMRKVAFKADLPKEIVRPLGEMTGIDKENISFLASKLRDNGLSFYHGLSTPKRLIAIQACRWIIAKLAMRMDYEARQVIQPPRRKDPIDHLVDVFYPIIEEIIIPEIAKIKDGIIEINTEHNTVTHVKLAQDSARGTMATHGHIGQWEDDSGENA